MTGEDADAYSNSFYIREASAPDNSHWMRQLMAAKPNVKLNEITMPGSHDAGMYVDNSSKVATGLAHEGAGEWAVTQSQNIRNQLRAGARYFDLRIYYDDNKVQWAFHGQFKGAIFYGGFGGKFETILEDIFNFFDRVDSTGAKPEEVVILQIKPYVGAANLRATIDLVETKLGSYLYKNPQGTVPDFGNTELEDLKRKVTVTYDSAFYSLIRAEDAGFPNYNCGNQKTGELLPIPGGAFVVYDVYSDANGFAAMEKDQTDKLNRYAGYGNPYLFLLSWTLTGHTGGILDLELLSRMANPQLAKALHKLQVRKLPNIVYLDYVNGYLCSAIIALNYRPAQVPSAQPVPGSGVPVLA